MAQSDLSIVPLEFHDALNIFKRLRQGDVLEARYSGFTTDRLPECCTKTSYALKIDNDPVAMFGTHEFTEHVSVWFYATDRLIETGTVFTRVARQFLQDAADEYADKDLIVFVWVGADDNIRWLERLGFEYSGFDFVTPDTLFHILQFKG
ncbi:hypothetical protein [Dongia sp.]|uniref:hypothetical protein n=1 Tax=Dongia sp. TaxID=1977262 RepID=UPI0035B2CF26